MAKQEESPQSIAKEITLRLLPKLTAKKPKALGKAAGELFKAVFKEVSEAVGEESEVHITHRLEVVGREEDAKQS